MARHQQRQREREQQQLRRPLERRGQQARTTSSSTTCRRTSRRSSLGCVLIQNRPLFSSLFSLAHGFLVLPKNSPRENVEFARILQRVSHVVQITQYSRAHHRRPEHRACVWLGIHACLIHPPSVQSLCKSPLACAVRCTMFMCFCLLGAVLWLVFQHVPHTAYHTILGTFFFAAVHRIHRVRWCSFPPGGQFACAGGGWGYADHAPHDRRQPIGQRSGPRASPQTSRTYII